MRKKLLIKIVLCMLFLWLCPSAVQAQKRVHSVYFEGTDYELNVYRIYGKKQGKTLLLIGGIQGDEPGGFLSADHYADISLAKGNLIVVPRANFQSIVLRRRQINEDMNRKFAEDPKVNYETKVVTILKQLIDESDCLLNLHDGSGFYADTWISDDRNPKRYGQSIISDADVFVHPESGETVQLGRITREVIETINRQIEQPLYHFHYNNHRTSEKDSTHKEQRKSATYYALHICGIPAFGIETAKSLPLETKVRHHNLAINAFMEKFGIIQDTPGIHLDEPRLSYLVIAVNESMPVVVKDRQTLHVNPGDTVKITHIEANYERGLSADITGNGTISDIRKKIRLTESARIVVRKDYYPCGVVYLAVNKEARPGGDAVFVSDAPLLLPRVERFWLRVNGKSQSVTHKNKIVLRQGDTFEIVDVEVSGCQPADLVVNFKGFVGDRKNNTGEDRGYVIYTDRDLWAKYAMGEKHNTYQIIATYEDQPVGNFFVVLDGPTE